MNAGEELWARDDFVVIVSISRKSRTVKPEPAMLCFALIDGLPRKYFDINVDDWAVDSIKPATVRVTSKEEE